MIQPYYLSPHVLGGHETQRNRHDSGGKRDLLHTSSPPNISRYHEASSKTLVTPISFFHNLTHRNTHFDGVVVNLSETPPAQHRRTSDLGLPSLHL